MPSRFEEYLRSIQATRPNEVYLEYGNDQDLGYSIPMLKEVYRQAGVSPEGRFAKDWYRALQDIHPDQVLSFYLPVGQDIGNPALRAKMAEDWAITAATYGYDDRFPIPLSAREAGAMLAYGLSPQTIAGLDFAAAIQETKRGGGLQSAYAEYAKIQSALSLFSSTAVSPQTASLAASLVLDAWDSYRYYRSQGRIGKDVSFSEFLAKTAANTLSRLFPGFDLEKIVAQATAVPLVDLSVVESYGSGNSLGQPPSTPQLPSPRTPSTPPPLPSSSQREVAAPTILRPVSMDRVSEAAKPLLFEEVGALPVTEARGGALLLPRGDRVVEFRRPETVRDVAVAPGGLLVRPRGSDGGFFVPDPFADYWVQSDAWLGAPRSQVVAAPGGRAVQLFERGALLYQNGSVYPISFADLKNFVGDELYQRLVAAGLIPGTGRPSPQPETAQPSSDLWLFP
ncbi:MAG: hypothetical protein QXT91_00670 [Candidatus Caldarchaeum sp.]